MDCTVEGEILDSCVDFANSNVFPSFKCDFKVETKESLKHEIPHPFDVNFEKNEKMLLEQLKYFCF